MKRKPVISIARAVVQFVLATGKLTREAQQKGTGSIEMEKKKKIIGRAEIYIEWGGQGGSAGSQGQRLGTVLNSSVGTRKVSYM